LTADYTDDSDGEKKNPCHLRNPRLKIGMPQNIYVKVRSIAALALFLGSTAFISQPIEVRAAESHFTGEGMPINERDRWKSSAAIASAALANKRYDVAVRYLTAALAGDAKGVDAAYLYKARGDAYVGKGDFQKAAADFARAVNFVPTDIQDYVMRGFTFQKMGNYKAAASDYAKGIALSPDSDKAIGFLAWLRATCPESSVRDGREALRASTKACELTRWKNASQIDTLAAAYAEMGNFDQAVKFQQQALQMRFVSPDLRQEMQERLSLYQKRKPYREPATLRARR
jgi:tetratricopeptide (TPR) repeat protein